MLCVLFANYIFYGANLKYDFKTLQLQYSGYKVQCYFLSLCLYSIFNYQEYPVYLLEQLSLKIAMELQTIFSTQKFLEHSCVSIHMILIYPF